MNLLTAWAVAGSALLYVPSAGTTIPARQVEALREDGGDRIVAPPPPTPAVEYVVIQTEKADYLQTEFSGLPAGAGVVLDSFSIRRQERSTYELGVSLEVHWRWAVKGRDTLFPAARRMQFLDSLPLARQYAPVGAIVRMVARVDTIWTCQEGRCQMAPVPKVVVNYEPRPVFCAIACEDLDSATVAERIRERFRRTKTALALIPDAKERSVVRGIWARTTGEERLVGISERLPGNLANWMARDQAHFQISGIATDPAGKRPLPWSVAYHTGPLQYVYNRTASPNLMILEGPGPRVVDDTLVKHGLTLYLSGNTRRICGRVVDDSVVVRDSWFVVPDSGTGAAIEEALSPGFCGNRSSAWRLSGDMVWLGGHKWPVPVGDLVGTSSQVPRTSTPAPRLVGNLLTLPFDARVVARDPSGRRLGGGLALPAGVHSIDLAGHRGVFLLEIRPLGGREIRVLGGTSLER